ncbi:MAG: endonuclease III [Clostridia bacterium]|nr:endonuclease III [Clostridia bacterium]
MGTIRSKLKITEILDILAKAYPDAGCALNHSDVFQLLCSVMLSAQTTDVSVNKVTPALFSKYPDAFSLSEASADEISEIIHSIGMYKTKAKNLILTAKELAGKYGGEVPEDYEALVSLPGVGRKTANVVLAVGFGQQRIAVDTHVLRVANRIGLCCEKDPLHTELALMEILPQNRLTEAHHSLIFHGRRCCSARKPLCAGCPIASLCMKNL